MRLCLSLQVAESYVQMVVQAAADIKAWFEDPAKIRVSHLSLLIPMGFPEDRMESGKWPH